MEFFIAGLSKKKVYLDVMSILSIIVSLEPACHNPPPLRRPTSPLVNPKLRMSYLGHVHMPSTDIHIPYV
jgi:hypothetical protein